MKNKITPVLLGADLNCYNVARAFHEAYNVKSYAFGRYAIGATEYTKIISFKIVNNFDDPDTMVYILNAFAGEHNGETLILLGCTDDYAALIIKNKERLKGFVIPYIDAPLMEDITLKEHFYRYCDEYKIPYPETVIYEKGQELKIPFKYPVIIKPSSSILYWKYPFEGMKKVYRAASFEDAKNIIDDIYGAGYPEKLIIQDFIPGDDQMMYTMTCYSDNGGRVRMMCLGHVLLEEHTPKGLGNHAAIITTQNDRLSAKLKTFLEGIKYVGFSNFDVKYDTRDGEYKVFEINIRQGRSNYYVTAAGDNIARCVVEDRVIGSAYTGCHVNANTIYWRYVPDNVVYKFCSPENIAKVRECIADDRAFSSMKYKYDLKLNPRRRLYIMLYERGQIKKFDTYYIK